MDSAVSGLTYQRADGFTGTTGAQGEIEFRYFENIEFLVGNVSLGSTSPLPQLVFVFGQEDPPYYLTPEDLTSDNPASRVAARDSNPLVNKLIFLQTLDADGDLDNGIQIPDAAQELFREQSIDFQVATRDFIKGDFRDSVKALNNLDAFTGKRPRKIQSEREALMHFGALDTGFPPRQRTFTSWWREQNGCLDIGKSRLATYGSLVEFCPNLNGLDSCYQGVTTDKGKVLLPKMKSNRECRSPYDKDQPPDAADCLGYEQFVLQANLKITDEGLQGNFEASCKNTLADQPQTQQADFIDYTQFDGAQYKLFEEIKAHTENGSCSVNTDCSLLILGAETYNDRDAEVLAYSKQDIDEALLEFQTYKYNELTNGYRYYYEGYGLINIELTYQQTHPEAHCVSNICQLVEVPN